MNAGCHWEELDIHLNSALRNRMRADEIKDALLRSFSYCSTPAANITLKISKAASPNLRWTKRVLPSGSLPGGVDIDGLRIC